MLFNIVKHAKAKQITLETAMLGDDMRIIVSDDGVGVELDVVTGKKRSQGFGLFRIREIVRDLGGRLEAEATTRGSRIILTIPVIQHEATRD